MIYCLYDTTQALYWQVIGIKQNKGIMIQRSGLIVTLFIALATLWGCDDQGSGGASGMMPNITGASGDVLVLMNDRYYESNAGKSLKMYLKEEVRALPQPEPMFNVNQIRHNQFKKIMHAHRNMVRVYISDTVKNPAFEVQKNIWAAPQYVIDIKAPDTAKFVELIERKGAYMQKVFKEAERRRTTKSYRRYEDPEIPKTLAKDHHLYMTVPKGYSIAMNKKNFIWILKEKGNEDFYQSINIYYQDYLDTSDFSKSHLLKMREKFMKNIEGAESGTRMITEPMLPVSYDKISFNERYAVKMRGLWRKTGNIIMGGPFISYSFVDEARNRMITVEGWVYAPKYNKRNYIWQLDAILQTIKALPVGHLKKDNPG